MKKEGRAWTFGDDISTDLITPGRYSHLLSEPEKLAEHCLEDAREDFAEHVEEGDFVVAGESFGMGSSREHAPLTIKIRGVSAVIAKSFERIFYRNAVNLGLPVITMDTDPIQDGDILSVDFEAGTVAVPERDLTLSFQALPEFMEQILQEGGLVNYINNRGGDFE